MKVTINDQERDVFPVVNESGVHMAGEQGGLLYGTEDGLRVSVLFANEATGAASSQQNDSEVATAPAADIYPPAHNFELAHSGTSSDIELLPDADREVWPRHKALFLITKYKELNELVRKNGGFKTKKMMWTKLADILNAEFGGHFTAVQVENKWKSMERQYKKTKAKSNSTGHSRVSCHYEDELAEVLEKQHHITPTVLLTQGRVITAEKSLEEDTASGEEMQEEPEPRAAPQLGSTNKRRRRETPAESLLKVIRDAEVAREKRHQERMALLRELVAAVRSNKE